MPLQVRMSTKLLNPFLSDFSRKQWAETVSPESDSFMANINTAFVQQIFHISKRKWITHIHHNRQADDFGRRLEVAKRGEFCHSEMLGRRPAQLKPVFSDKTRSTKRRDLQKMGVVRKRPRQQLPCSWISLSRKPIQKRSGNVAGAFRIDLAIMGKCRLMALSRCATQRP